MTDEIERGARELLDRIVRLGGTLRAIETGMVQREIQESAYRAQRAIDRGETPIVGVTIFRSGEATSIPTFRVDPDTERVQRARVERVRHSRDAAGCQRALDAVRRAAEDQSNLMPPIVEAVRAKATVGEISNLLRSVFGEYHDAS
jgi:methylmalonyl-CoA mutase N-terminal domain/subunit